jgi:hypothetical protein
VFGDGARGAVLHVAGALGVVPAPEGAVRAPIHAVRHRAHLSLPDPTSPELAAALESLRRDERRAPRPPTPALRLETRAWWEPEPAAPEPLERYCELRAAIEGTAHTGHRLLGHPVSVRDDAVAEAGADRLLLQLSSSWKLGWRFAGDGVLYLCIDDGDLRARRFERAVAICQR